VEEIAELFPSYKLEKMIGRGGMGAVYRARQSALDRLVAIKLVPGEAAANDDFAERFHTETRALVRLQHPHIVAIHDSGETSAGQRFFVMAVEGTDLARSLAGGRLAPARALEILSAVCAALQCAHEQGIVHRDIKPANVLLANDGAVKVADFGLAYLRADTDVATSRLTLAGTSLGTPDYMAPEQRAGGAVDHRADIYSLGVMFYEMLTGELPHGAWAPPSRAADSDVRLDAVVTRAIQTDPAKRFQRAADLAEQIARIQAFPRGRRRWLRWAGAALIAGCVAAGSTLFWPAQRTVETLAPSPVWQPLVKTPPAAAEGDVDLLAGLDLGAAVVAGDWVWTDGRVGHSLSLPLTSDAQKKLLRLPLRAANRGYNFVFELWLEESGADIAVVLPAGRTRVALLLDHLGASGLDLVSGVRWNENNAAVKRALPPQRYVVVEIRVRVEAESVHINVQIDGAPFIDWRGRQSELSLGNSPFAADSTSPDEPLTLASFAGGVRIRKVLARLLP